MLHRLQFLLFNFVANVYMFLLKEILVILLFRSEKSVKIYPSDYLCPLKEIFSTSFYFHSF